MLSDKEINKLYKRISIELKANDFSYQDSIPLGSLNGHSINGVFMSEYSLSIKLVFLQWFYLFSRLFTSFSLEKNKAVLLLRPNDSERVVNAFSTIDIQLTNEKKQFCVVSDIYKGASVKTYFNFVYNLLKLYKDATSAFKYLFLSKEITRKQYVYLVNEALIQGLRLEIVKDNLAKTSFRYIITDYDRNVWIAPVILSANRCKIRTGTLIHGAVFPPYLYIPFLAQDVFCWGEAHKVFFEKYNPTEVNYIVTGSTSFTSYNNDLKINLREKYKIRDNTLLLCYYSQNFASGKQVEIAAAIVEAILRSGKNIHLFIKLHPADKQNIYKEILTFSTPENTITLLNIEEKLSDVIDAADLNVVVSSNVAFDALSAKKPICFFDLVSEDKTGVALMFEFFSTVRVYRGVEDLHFALNRLAGREDVWKEFQTDQCLMTYHNYIKETGVSAGLNIVSHIAEYL